MVGKKRGTGSNVGRNKSADGEIRNLEKRCTKRRQLVLCQGEKQIGCHRRLPSEKSQRTAGGKGEYESSTKEKRHKKPFSTDGKKGRNVKQGKRGGTGEKLIIAQRVENSDCADIG